MENENFERLASSLSNSERREMLEKIEGEQELEDQDPEKPKNNVAEKSLSKENTNSAEIRLKKESIFLRFWLWLVSLIKNVPQIELYNEMQIDAIARKIEASFPGIISKKNESLLGGFYERLLQLKSCADFFKPYFKEIESEGDEYILFLATLVIPEVTDEIDSKVDPYSEPFSKTPSPEIRSSFLHKMDEILSQMTQDQRSAMRLAYRSSQWLCALTKLPLNMIVTTFDSLEGGSHTCKYGVLSGEISSLATVLLNEPVFQNEMLNSLYFFNKKRFSQVNEDESYDLSEAQYIEKANAQISMIKMFNTNVPLKNIEKIINDNIDWETPNFSGGSDWFQKFKAQLKIRFDKKWEAWSHDCKKEALREKFEETYNKKKFPLLPDRPWTLLWEGIPFKYELTAGFLTWFFSEIFPKYEESLKITVVKGDFIKKENRLAFQDALNDVTTVSLGLSALCQRLKPTGESGQAFENLSSLGNKTYSGRMKAETLMSEIETQIASYIASFGAACRAFVPLINGIFSLVKDSRYGSLSNLMTIQGKNNEEFRYTLEGARKAFETAYEFITNLEPIDTPSLNGVGVF